jgi:hypothetical protein
MEGHGIEECSRGLYASNTGRVWWGIIRSTQLPSAAYIFFLILLRISLLEASACLLVRRCSTLEKYCFILNASIILPKSLPMNWVPLFVIMTMGIPNLQMMLLKVKLVIFNEVIVVNGYALIHLVKYFPTTTKCLSYPGAMVKVPNRSIPHVWKGHGAYRLCNSSGGRWGIGAYFFHSSHFCMCFATSSCIISM